MKPTKRTRIINQSNLLLPDKPRQCGKRMKKLFDLVRDHGKTTLSINLTTDGGNRIKPIYNRFLSLSFFPSTICSFLSPLPNWITPRQTNTTNIQQASCVTHGLNTCLYNASDCRTLISKSIERIMIVSHQTGEKICGSTQPIQSNPVFWNRLIIFGVSKHIR